MSSDVSPETLTLIRRCWRHRMPVMQSLNGVEFLGLACMKFAMPIECGFPTRDLTLA